MSEPMNGAARDKVDRINKSMRTSLNNIHKPQFLLPKLGAVRDEVVEKDYHGEGEMEGLGAVMHLRAHAKGSLHEPGSPMHVPAPTQDVEKSGTENFPVSALALRMSPLNVNGDASALAKDSESSKKAWESRQRAKEEGAAEKPAAKPVSGKASGEDSRAGAVQSANHGLSRVNQAIANLKAENFDQVLDSVKRLSGEMSAAQTYAERMGDTESAKKFGAAYQSADAMYRGDADPSSNGLKKLKDQIAAGIDGVKAFKGNAGKKAWESRQRAAQQQETSNIVISGMQRRARAKAEKDAPSGPVAKLFLPQREEVAKVHPQIIGSDSSSSSDRSEAARRAWEKRGMLQPGALSSDDMKLRQAGLDWFKKMRGNGEYVPGSVTSAVLSGVKGLKKEPEITPLFTSFSHKGSVNSATQMAQSISSSLKNVGYKSSGEVRGKAYKGGYERTTLFEHPTGQSVNVTIGTSENADGQTPARLEVSRTIDPNKYESYMNQRNPRNRVVQVGKSLDYLEPMLEKEMVEKIFKASGFDKLPLTDKARGVIEDAISRGAVPSTEYTGKIMVEHAMPEEPPAYARPGKDGLKVGDRVIPLQWMSAGRFGATFDLPYIPEAMKVKKLFVGPAKVSKNAYPPGKVPGDLSKVETVTEDRLWGMELESEEVRKDGEELCPCPVVTKDTTMVLRLEPLAQPTGEVNPQ